jgi:transcriptional regulator GlxA family with amidase domain
MKKFFFTFCILLIYGCTQVQQKKQSSTIETKIESVEKKKSFPKLEPNWYNVAFLIMNGTYNTEFTAPFDIFQHTQYRKNIKQMNVFTVANTDRFITTFEGVKIIPDYNYVKDSLPRIDILVIPSAEHHLDTDLDDTVMIDFVKQVDKKAMFMTSHCDGAFVLAKAGVLDSVVSTTFPSDVDQMRSKFPNLDIREKVLFVHDKKYITSAGGAKSFEAALYLCEYLYGAEITKLLAEGLVIDWNLKNVPHLVIDKQK